MYKEETPFLLILDENNMKCVKKIIFPLSLYVTQTWKLGENEMHILKQISPPTPEICWTNNKKMGNPEKENFNDIGHPKKPS